MREKEVSEVTSLLASLDQLEKSMYALTTTIGNGDIPVGSPASNRPPAISPLQGLIVQAAERIRILENTVRRLTSVIEMQNIAMCDKPVLSN